MRGAQRPGPREIRRRPDSARRPVDMPCLLPGRTRSTSSGEPSWRVRSPWIDRGAGPGARRTARAPSDRHARVGPVLVRRRRRSRPLPRWPTPRAHSQPGAWPRRRLQRPSVYRHTFRACGARTRARRSRWRPPWRTGAREPALPGSAAASPIRLERRTRWRKRRDLAGDITLHADSAGHGTEGGLGLDAGRPPGRGRCAGSVRRGGVAHVTRGDEEGEPECRPGGAAAIDSECVIHGVSQSRA